MNKVKAILVDDELNARENLRYLLHDFCSEVTVVSEASNIDDAVRLIEKEKPDLVFLDIEMPEKNGFQIFNEFDKIDFQVIFVTAYDHYAIKAFQVAAIDYLLKPIDISLLQNAVKKAIFRIEQNTKDSRIKILQENRKSLQKIAIPYKNDYAIIAIEDIICIQADRMYAIIHTIKNRTYVASKKLNYYENLFQEEEAFVRVHRSWMVNTNHILIYSKRERQLKLTNEKLIPVSKGYKESFETSFTS
ncbi:LytR/AlgR family response regulator transcription factor [Tenacibaculum jejuense]|uniref:Two-component system response regulatory protein, LytTR family n=1 Tax=Tenacibaculum jejuense TaxID=584609 RepID=A0A238U7L2_9FLAO|nr:response regulator transcription factor [Tenacibaculum jejuense]SNR15173.1 Two-component system response regulatory protein, LytTR family [Tenacibaculum jejuense]